MALTFITTASGTVGTPIPVTVYEGGVALNPATSPVSWSFNPSAGASVVPTSTGYNITFSQGSGGGTWTGTATQGAFSGTLQFAVTAPLQFTSP